MAIYKTQIQPEVLKDKWVSDGYLDILIKCDQAVVGSAEPPTAGTQVSWSCPDGSGSITFFMGGHIFVGSRWEQYEKEPVGWRGQLEGWPADSRDYI